MNLLGRRRKRRQRRNLFCTLTLSHFLGRVPRETESAMLRATCWVFKEQGSGASERGREPGEPEGQRSCPPSLLSNAGRSSGAHSAFRVVLGPSLWSPGPPVTGLKPWSRRLPSAEDSCGTGAGLWGISSQPSSQELGPEYLDAGEGGSLCATPHSSYVGGSAKGGDSLGSAEQVRRTQEARPSFSH